MNLPQFNAEESLGPAKGTYRANTVFGRSGTGEVLPMQDSRVISSAINEGGRTVDCDTCVGGECVGCLEKMLHKGEFGGLDPGGGGGGPGLNRASATTIAPRASHRGRLFFRRVADFVSTLFASRRLPGDVVARYSRDSRDALRLAIPGSCSGRRP
jgi:hypothetical protein